MTTVAPVPARALPTTLSHRPRSCPGCQPR